MLGAKLLPGCLQMWHRLSCLCFQNKSTSSEYAVDHKSTHGTCCCLECICHCFPLDYFLHGNFTQTEACTLSKALNHAFLGTITLPMINSNKNIYGIVQMHRSTHPHIRYAFRMYSLLHVCVYVFDCMHLSVCGLCAD